MFPNLTSHSTCTKMISSPLCCVTDFRTQHNHTYFSPEDGVGHCQKMKMYLSDPDIAVWQPVHPLWRKAHAPGQESDAYTNTLQGGVMGQRGAVGGSTRGKGSVSARVFLYQTHTPSLLLCKRQEKKSHTQCSVAQLVTRRYTGYWGWVSDWERKDKRQENNHWLLIDTQTFKEVTDSLPYVWLLSRLHSKCTISFWNYRNGANSRLFTSKK